MSKLLNEIKVSVLGPHEIHFKTTRDIKRWLNSEAPFWSGLSTEKVNDYLKGQWQKQCQFYTEVRGELKAFEEALLNNNNHHAAEHNNRLQSQFKLIADGSLVTKEYPFFPAIVAMSKKSPDAACLLALAASSRHPELLESFFRHTNVAYKTLIDFILLQNRSEGSKDWLIPQRQELTELKEDFQKELFALEEKFDEQKQAIEKQIEYTKQSNQAKESEWQALKRNYDEQLALLAPTEYWAGRAKSHKKSAVIFAFSFAFILLICVVLFFSFGIPQMLSFGGNKELSFALALLSIAIPAFAGVWALKILSRLLSEHLQMMQDAQERETLVKTFLALMRDSAKGEPMIKDDDRILILHSLFRPSSITAVDDAPPVHWFDILTRKVGAKTGSRQNL